MKKIFSLAMLMLLSISCSNAQETFSKDALDFKMTALDDTKISFKEIIKKHKGKKVVLELWASWCGDCVKNMPNVKKMEANNPNVAFVFLSFDKTPEAWKEGIKKHELTGDHYLVGETMKGSFGKAVNLDWIPRYIVLDEKGKIILYKAIETENDKVEALLK